MAHRHRGGGGGRLSHSLDKEVYQVVRKIIDEREQFGDSNSQRLSFAQIYDEIRSSNSSLNRKPKKLLEDSVERVIESVHSERAANQDDDEISDEILDAPGARDETMPKVSNGLNKSIVGAWATSNGVPSRSGTATPKREQREKERDRDRDRERQPNGEPAPKRRKTEKSSTSIDKAPPTHISFEDMGGIGPTVRQLYNLVALPMLNPRFLSMQKLQPTRGILLHGPPGCGKTMLAHALAAELGVNFISIAAPSIVSGMSGESEKTLRDHFDEAKKAAPCLMFIDEIDAITPKRESAQREMEKRIVAQLLTCMDELDPAKNDGKPVVVLAATNRPDSLDPALRRGGRFDKEIVMPVPNEPTRERILRSLTREWNLADDVDFAVLARRTPGCVGADLKDLVLTTANVASERYLKLIEEAAQREEQHLTNATDIDQPSTQPLPIDPDIAQTRAISSFFKNHPDPDPTTLDFSFIATPTTTTNEHTIFTPFANPASSNLTTINPTRTLTTLISQTDFLAALPLIQPSALREGFATVPTTKFSDIGALTPHISTLRRTLINPILHPTLYTSLSLSSTAGILLWGPPGNGKTLLAKAVANASHANFISVKGPELLNKYVGESERSVRTLFSRARSSVPVIIFFDELDALVPRRDGGNSEASSRVVNTLLTEMDGVGASREGIYIIAATNRPDIIDAAMLRPGRLETLLYVGLPSETDRIDILRTLTRKMNAVEWSPQLEELARGCEGFSGADLESLTRQAVFAAVERCTDVETGEILVSDTEGVRVLVGDFLQARAKVQPSVSEEECARFLALREQLGRN